VSRTERGRFVPPLRSKLTNLPSWTWLNFRSVSLVHSRCRDTIVIQSHDLLVVDKIDAQWMAEPLTSGIKSSTLLVKGKIGTIELRRSKFSGKHGLAWVADEVKRGSSEVLFEEPKPEYVGKGTILVSCLLAQSRQERFLSVLKGSNLASRPELTPVEGKSPLIDSHENFSIRNHDETGATDTVGQHDKIEDLENMRDGIHGADIGSSRQGINFQYHERSVTWFLVVEAVRDDTTPERRKYRRYGCGIISSFSRSELVCRSASR
jgi:hypothetical protein